MQQLLEFGEQHQAEGKIIVNGEEVDKQKFEEMQRDPKIKLTKLSENTFKKLERLDG